jgi:plastocyanin
MKNKMIIILIIFLLALGAFYVFYNKNLFLKANNEVIHQVALLGGRADPDELVIKVGESIQFNSKDGKSHNISEGEGNDYDKSHEHNPQNFSESGTFGPDEAFILKFNKIGTYFFHDHLNPDIYVTVVVYDPTK